MLKKWREEKEGELSLEMESVGRSGKGIKGKEGKVQRDDLDRSRGVDIEKQKVVGPQFNGNGVL